MAKEIPEKYQVAAELSERVDTFVEFHSRAFAKRVAEELMEALKTPTGINRRVTERFVDHARRLGYFHKLEPHEIDEGKEDVFGILTELKSRLKEAAKPENRPVSRPRLPTPPLQATRPTRTKIVPLGERQRIARGADSD